MAMKVLVGYLATSGGADALALGVRLARTLHADLDLTMVLPASRLPAAPDYERHLADQAEEWLAQARETVPAEIAVASHVFFADSSTDGLITAAGRLEADLIVVGGGGGGLAGSLSLGSVVNELLHSAPLPVAVAPRGLREAPAARVHKVTCAIGQRAGARLLLETAVQFARAAGTPLRLVSLVALDPLFGNLRGDVDAILDHARAHARAVLEEAKAELPQGFPVSATVVDGPTVEEAVAKLDWRDGDLIMVGSSRLGAPRRLFLGSTAAKMLRVLKVPMVVVPRDQLHVTDLP
jgi:nucleotide-binding universal stress UspA family protein